MKIKHLFFDLDRTLWDFEANSLEALKQLYVEFNLGSKIEHFNHFHHTYVRVNADLWRLHGRGKITKEELRDGRFSKTLQLHDFDDLAMAIKMSERYLEVSPYQTKLFPNALETLAELKKMGFDLHIITNGFKEVQHIKLEHSQLKPFFNQIICSEEVGFSKPDPRVFQYAMNLASAIPNESVMIGDDKDVDILGGNNAGMYTILFDENPKNLYPKEMQRIKDLSEIPFLITML